MKKLSGLNTPTPGTNIVIWAVPGDSISVAVIAAIIWLELIIVVSRTIPFHLTLMPSKKFVPFTTNVKSPPPATALVGAIEEIWTTGAVTVKGMSFDRAPPGDGLNTVMKNVPGKARS
jgi:hypothetical protein